MVASIDKVGPLQRAIDVLQDVDVAKATAPQ